MNSRWIPTSYSILFIAIYRCYGPPKQRVIFSCTPCRYVTYILIYWDVLQLSGDSWNCEFAWIWTKKKCDLIKLALTWPSFNGFWLRKPQNDYWRDSQKKMADSRSLSDQLIISNKAWHVFTFRSQKLNVGSKQSVTFWNILEHQSLNS